MENLKNKDYLGKRIQSPLRVLPVFWDIGYLADEVSKLTLAEVNTGIENFLGTLKYCFMLTSTL